MRRSMINEIRRLNDLVRDGVLDSHSYLTRTSIITVSRDPNDGTLKRTETLRCHCPKPCPRHPQPVETL